MCRGKTFLLTAIVLIVASVANAGLVLTVNGFDTSMPIEVKAHDDIIIAVAGQTGKQTESYSVTCEMGGKLEPLPEPNTLAEKPKEGDYLFTFEDGELGLAIVNLTVGDVLDYQLILLKIPDANTVIFGIDSDAMYAELAKREAELLTAEADSVEATATESMQELVMDDSEGGMAMSMEGYDLVFNGVNKYTDPCSYSGLSILVTENGYVAFNKLTLENCTVDVNGFMELNSDVNLVDSTINVLGNLKAKEGITITETGVSSIIANGDSLNAGEIALDGKLFNRIRVYSDNVATDAEFIIVEEESSHNSTIKYTDFFGGWCNVQIYNKRLTSGIVGCRFFGADYGVYQNGIDELTDLKFCFFYWNYLSVYLGIDDCWTNEVEFLMDNVVIDNNFENPSYGIVMSGWQSIPDYSTLRIQNSIITNSHCGWLIDFDTSFYPPVMSNLAYYGNYYDDNLGSSGFQVNPMYLAQSPFVTPSDPNGWPYFTDPCSPVADVNVGDLWQSAPQQLLTSIYEDGTPRDNKGIGFGMPIPLSYATPVGELACDIHSDGIVNFRDFAEFAADWGFTGTSAADFDEDGTVDVNDLNILSQNWLQTSYIEPNVTDNGDYLTLTCQEVNDVNLSDFAIFLDGEYIATRDVVEYPELLIDKMKNSGGVLYIKEVAKGDNSKPYVTANVAVSFDAPLNGIYWSELFDPCNYFVVKGDVADGYIATISIKDMDNTILWSDDFSDDFITLIDPNNFSDEINYNVDYSYSIAPPEGSPPAAPTGSSSGSGSAIALGGKPTNKTAGLILCMLANGMTEGSGFTDTGTCRYAAKMMKAGGVYPITLLGFGGNNQVQAEMFKKVFYKYRNIRYLHIDAHGHYETDGAGFFGFDVLRTRFRFNDGDWPSHNSRIWTDRGLDVPEDYEWLSDSMENHYCLGHLPFRYDQIRFAIVECCYALRNIATEDAQGLVEYVDGAYEWEVDNNQNAHYQYPYSDICFALNIRSGKQTVFGSGELVIKGSIYPYFARFFNALWYGLGQEHLNVQDALTDWALPVASIHVMKQFRYRGAGQLSQIYLNSNP